MAYTTRRRLHTIARTEYRLNNFAIIDDEAEPADPAEPANFSLPVGGIIDEPIELEPAYTTLMTRDYCGNYIYNILKCYGIKDPRKYSK